MSNKKAKKKLLLTENEVRRFHQLAKLSNYTEPLLNESQSLDEDEGALEEEEELEEEMKTPSVGKVDHSHADHKMTNSVGKGPGPGGHKLKNAPKSKRNHLEEAIARLRESFKGSDEEFTDLLENFNNLADLLEMSYKKEPRGMRENDPEMDMGEPMGDEMPDEDPMGDMPMEEPMDDEMGEASVENLVSAIADAIAAETGISVSVEGETDAAPMDDMPMEDPMDEPMDDEMGGPPGAEPPMDLGDDELEEGGERYKGSIKEVPAQESKQYGKDKEIVEAIARAVAKDLKNRFKK